MLKAAIDIGTNSTRLLIADLSREPYETIVRKARVTRLGEKINVNKSIMPQAMARTLKAISIYKAIIDSYGRMSVNIASTSAARDASNVEDFIDLVNKETGLLVKVITAEEEAKNAFLGATYLLESEKNYLVMDIGGGSTELIAGKNKEVFKWVSKDIGCVRLYERFIKDNPPTIGQIEALKHNVEKIYGEEITLFNNFKPFKIIGTAGTVTSLSAIAQNLSEYDVDKVHHSVLSLKKIEEIFSRLSMMSTEERSTIPTMEKGREDVIVAGTAILIKLLQMLNKKSILVSETDILDGLMLNG